MSHRAALLTLVVATLLARAAAPATAHAAGYRDLDVGDLHACAIRADDDALACWGSNGYGQATPPPGRWAAVFPGLFHTCATRLFDRTPVCWGLNAGYYARFLPAGPVAQIANGVFFVCALSADGALRCSDKGPTCDVCDDGVPLSQTPPGIFTAVTAGFDHACAIRAGDRTLACWGDNALGEASPPPGAFASVSAGYDFTCGVRVDHALRCWGWDMDGRGPPPGSFATVSAGVQHACALGNDGSLACWGLDVFGETSPPPGSFREVSSGNHVSCAIRADGSLACWGGNAYGVTDPPPPPALDRMPPTVRCSASPAVLWPRNHKLAPVAVDVSVEDATSGPAGFVLLSVAAGAGDAQGWTVGTADTTGLLRAETRGGADRRYALRYRGFDRAGNASDCVASVTVPANRGRAAYARLGRS